MKKSYKNFWKCYPTRVWSQKRPPWKPSVNEIKFWNAAIRRVKKNIINPRVLVLGCTPEFRNMLSKYKFDVVLADVNPEMKKAMDKLIKHKPKRETFIKTSWLKMPFKRNTFDIVIGDTPHHNIKKSEYIRFFSEIKRVLGINGYFFLSSWYFGKQPEISLNSFIKKYKNNPHYFRNFQNRNHALCCLGKKMFYNKKVWEWNWGKIDNEISRAFNRQKFPPKDLKYLLFDYGDYTQVCPKEPDFSQLLNKFFQINAVWQDKTHSAMQFKKDFILTNK